MSNIIFNEQMLSNWKEIDSQNWQRIVNELLGIFFDSSSTQTKNLSEAFDEKDFKKIRNLAHSLKSSCGNVGAEKAHSILSQMELAANEQNFNQVQHLLNEYRITYLQSIEELKKYQQTLSS